MRAPATTASALLTSTPPRFDSRELQQCVLQAYGVRGTATPLSSERDQNACLLSDDGGRYLLKVANAAEDDAAIDFENSALQHLRVNAPDIPVPRLVPTRDGALATVLVGPDGRPHTVRLMTWLEGRQWREVPTTVRLRRELGEALATLGRGLRGLFHPAAVKPLLWDITRLADLTDKLVHVEDPELAGLCRHAIERFAEVVSPALPTLRGQVIYNDLNPSNVLVSHESPHTVTGVVDFGDMVHGPLVCDVAVAAAYQVGDGSAGLSPVVEFVAAYNRVTPLEEAEFAVLLDLIIARLVATVVVTSWRAQRYPGNRDYILRNAHAARSALRVLTGVDADAAFAEVRDGCTPASVRAAPGHPTVAMPTKRLAERRAALLGSAYRLFYDTPLHLVRGEGVWLHDAAGRRYLDAYNNVPLVGHSHPRVVQALAAQAATLNTHTRYLHHTILNYADRLLATFPAPLDRVMFGCTGSEANDLALRIARTVTGNQGVIVSQHAYHGGTGAIAECSPAYPSGGRRPAWVETVAPPDPIAEPAAATTTFLADLDAAIARMGERGMAPAALLLDAGFTSDGMALAPVGLLAAAAQRIRAAGGVYIADEVQVGFARLGGTMWGFQRDDVVPDLVTLGKPIGNGHPLAATVVRRDLLDAFAHEVKYFNTFGGNPVSCAVGLAVLDVFEDDDLAGNSRDTGAYLQQRLRTLPDRHGPLDVRGEGLFAGVRVASPATGTAAGLASRIVNGMRDRGVLIGSIGPAGDVLKIRPPLPFRPRHVDTVIDALDATLQALSTP